ncbi:MAG TPA: hypothetical protein VNF25_05270 [Actinomycetota bacterium]|jgi:hypothetical protein|nr:hypothetical protein [Actinomycetota bacterium]
MSARASSRFKVAPSFHCAPQPGWGELGAVVSRMQASEFEVATWE